MLANHLQIDESELRYVAELVELRPDAAAGVWRWRRCCVARGCGCWCPTSISAALRYVNSHDMRGIQLHHAEQHPMPTPNRAPSGRCCALSTPTIRAPPRPDHPGTAGKPCAWMIRQSSRNHAKAVTDQGLRKDSPSWPSRDDRQALRPSQYIFVGHVDSKITALREELDHEQRLYDAAHQASADLDRDRTELQQRRDAYRRVCEQFAQWSQIDTDTADDRVDALTDQYELLMDANPMWRALQRKAEDLGTGAWGHLPRQRWSRQDRHPTSGAPSCWT